MLNITKRRQRVTQVQFERKFDWQGETNWGFGFPCDVQGTVDVSKLAPEGAANYRACLTGSVDGRPVVDRGIVSWENHYYEPAEGRCVCGRTVVLENAMDNDCDCGRIYNGFGQELAPRAQWEENDGTPVYPGLQRED